MRARRVLEWGISSLSFVRPSVLPSAFRASSLRLEAEGRQRMYDPGARGRWWRSCRRSIGLRLLWCKRASALKQRQWQRCLPSLVLAWATEVLLRWGKDGPRRRRRRRTEGRSRRSVPWMDALGERRGGDRERDLVAQGEGERAADMPTARRNGRASEGRKCRDRSGRSLPSRLRLCNPYPWGLGVFFTGYKKLT